MAKKKHNDIKMLFGKKKRTKERKESIEKIIINVVPVASCIPCFFFQRRRRREGKL